jgi:hypothetical protein
MMNIIIIYMQEVHVISVPDDCRIAVVYSCMVMSVISRIFVCKLILVLAKNLLFHFNNGFYLYKACVKLYSMSTGSPLELKTYVHIFVRIYGIGYV